MYNEEEIYSVRSLVLVHILNFQRDLVMRFIRIELLICSTSKVDKVHVVSLIKQIQRQLCFDVPTPS